VFCFRRIIISNSPSVAILFLSDINALYLRALQLRAETCAQHVPPVLQMLREAFYRRFCTHGKCVDRIIWRGNLRSTMDSSHVRRRTIVYHYHRPQHHALAHALMEPNSVSSDS
jgi:hypothetical protein